MTTAIATAPQPTSYLDHPVYVPERDKLTELQTKLSALTANRDQLQAKLRDENPTDSDAARLIATGEIQQADETSEGALAECSRQIRVVEAACQIQGETVQRAETAAGREIAEAYRGEYTDCLKKIATTLTRLRDLATRERSIRLTLQNDAPGWTGILHQMPLSFLRGQRSTKPSQTEQLDDWLAEAAKHYNLK